MKFEIKNRWSGAAQYSCELSAQVAGKPYGLQLGFAIRSAHDSDADLSDADLRHADLRHADLRHAVLRHADLRHADLRHADLRDADLSGAVLSGADLRHAVLSDACPVKIPEIHKAVYAAASQPAALDMAAWHSCKTTHCRAGWVVHLAGEGGKALEKAMGTAAAAALIYMVNDPKLARVPDFYCDNTTAMADMARLASVAQ